MLFGVKEIEQFDLICNGITSKHRSQGKVLRATIDNKFCFDEHVINICKAANKKLNTPSRINHYMKLNQNEQLLSSFFISHFSYYPLIWMFCSKKIYQEDKCCLRMIFMDYSRWLQVSLPHIIRGSIPNIISPAISDISGNKCLLIFERHLL